MIKIAGGQLLVDGSEYRGMECVARADYEKVNQSDIDGLYDIYWEDGQQFNLYNASMGGALRGLIQIRDGNNGENFTGMVTNIGSTTIGNVLHDTVTVEVSKHYLTDLNKCNLSGSGKINLGNQIFYYDSWEYTRKVDAQGEETYSFTFTLSDDHLNASHLTNDRVGKPATTGASLDYQGIPYYMSQMNEWLRTFSQKFNDILTSGYDSQNRQGVMMFTAKHAADSEQYDFPDGSNGTANTRYDKKPANGSSISVTNTDDSYYRMTAGNFSILSALESDPSRLANRFDQGDGVEQSDLLVALKSMVNDKDQMSFRGSNATEFLQNILSDIALNAQRANTFYQSFSDISASIDTQRISISGVDEDEEAVNLVKYQNGYNLASKMIQTLTEIYDKLILETGV